MNEEPLNLKKMDLAISIDDGMVLKELRPVDVSQKYVEWLNDYDITKYTEQKYQQHCIESTKILLEKNMVHLMRYYSVFL